MVSLVLSLPILVLSLPILPVVHEGIVGSEKGLETPRAGVLNSRAMATDEL